jgi:hypothetical protein
MAVESAGGDSGSLISIFPALTCGATACSVPAGPTGGWTGCIVGTKNLAQGLKAHLVLRCGRVNPT